MGSRSCPTHFHYSYLEGRLTFLLLCPFSFISSPAASLLLLCTHKQQHIYKYAYSFFGSQVDDEYVNSPLLTGDYSKKSHSILSLCSICSTLIQLFLLCYYIFLCNCIPLFGFFFHLKTYSHQDIPISFREIFPIPFFVLRFFSPSIFDPFLHLTRVHSSSRFSFLFHHLLLLLFLLLGCTFLNSFSLLSFL